MIFYIIINIRCPLDGLHYVNCYVDLGLNNSNFNLYPISSCKRELVLFINYITCLIK